MSHVKIRAFWGEIARATNLPLSKIKKSLMVLIHQNLANFEAHPRGTVKYSINADRVLCLVRYSRYIYCTKMLYGEAGEFIVEEILLNGRLCMSSVLQKVLERQQGAGIAESVKEKFVDLVKTSFLCRVPYPDPDAPASKIPSLILPDDVMYKIPEVKMYLLKQKLAAEASEEPPAKKVKMEDPKGDKQPDEKEYWRVNIDRFDQHLRDQLIVEALSKRIGAKAGEVVRTMLRLSETRCNPKDAFSAPVSRNEIHQFLKRETTFSPQELDSYLSLVADDALGLGVLASIVQDRFGAKSCRIFRLLLQKKYLEQKQIEELAMITARDAKEMTYKMFEEKFVLAQELPRTPDYAPSRMIYLFHVDIPQLSRQVLEWCYKAMSNMMLRRMHVTEEQKRLLDKKQRVDLILSTMRPENSSPEQIAEVKEMVTPPERRQLAYVRHVTSNIGLGEVQLDKTILVLQLYINSLSK
ncbi:hypothetical protein MTO96_017233 [Rhipicephalus appendiculatus]